MSFARLSSWQGPYEVMKQRFGRRRASRSAGEVISRSFQEAVVSRNLRPAGQPSIEAERWKRVKDVEYTATFEVFPTVSVERCQRVRVTKLTVRSADDVMTIIAVFRSSRVSWL